MIFVKLKKVFSFIPDIFSRHEEGTQHKPNMRSQLSLEKQKKLEALYRQLLSNKEFVASGRVQFVGLEQIKKKMGRKWSGISALVYEIAEEVIQKHIRKTDLFLGYKDDSYAIIFSDASVEEAKQAVVRIANEIRQRLFLLDDSELKKIEIKNSAQKVKVSSFLEEQFPEVAENSFSQDILFKPEKKSVSSLYSEKVDVVAEGYRSKNALAINENTSLNELNCMYMPLWETKRSALTTYICLPADSLSEKKSFYAYHELFQGKSKLEQLQLDLKVLEHALSELAAIQKDGRKLQIACPIHYSTLYDFDSYEIYKESCNNILDIYKSFLVFIILTPGSETVVKDPYWFISPLKAYCYDIFVEVPIKHDTNFQLLKASGIDTVGVNLSNSDLSEQEKIGICNSFSSKAKYFKIQKTFSLGVASLSSTTSLVCAGFDYIGGAAVHEDVSVPDTAHRYRYEDLLADMIKSTPNA